MGQCLPTAPPPGVGGKPAMFQCPGGSYVAAGSACPHGGRIGANGMFVPPSVPMPPMPIAVPPVGPNPNSMSAIVERWRACQATPSAPACINLMGEIAKQRSICANPAAAGHHDCVELQAFLAAIGEGQVPGPSEAVPMPSEAVPMPMGPPPGMSPGVKKGLIAVGVLGVGLAIAAAVFAPG